MTLKLACADFTFPLLPHDKSLDLIAMLGFEGVDIGLFEGRSHLWPSRVFADLKASAKELKRQAARPRARARRRLPADGPRFRLDRPQPSRSLHPPPGARLVCADGRVRPRVRRPAHLGAAGRHLRGRARSRVVRALPRRAGLALPDGQLAGRHVFRRGARRLDRSDARVGRPARAVGPRADADARLHPLHPERRPGSRSRAADRPRQPLPRPRRPAGPVAGIVQGKRHRLWTRSRRDAAGRLRGLCRRRIRLDRLGALQRGRQPVGDDPDARLPPQARERCMSQPRPRSVLHGHCWPP